MSSVNPRNIDDLLLSAFDEEEEFSGRARGDESAEVGYLLRELPIPERAHVVPSTRPTMEQRGAASAALVQDLSSASGSQKRVAPEAPLTCPNCGAINPVTSKFCNACGHPLQAPPSTSDVGPSGAYRVPATMPVVMISINEDGSDGPRIELRFNDSVVGRAGDVRFPTDAFLSPKHARITIDGPKVFIEDLYSLNGTYVKLREECRLTPGDTFLMGRQVIRFEKFEHNIVPKARSSDGTRYMGSPPPGGQFKLLQIGIGGVLQSVFCLHESGAIIGREKGDVIFPRDKFMSGRHAQIFPRDDGHYYLVDLNSSNGTWIKIWERKQLGSGDFVFLGQQLFRIEF